MVNGIDRMPRRGWLDCPYAATISAPACLSHSGLRRLGSRLSSRSKLRDSVLLFGSRLGGLSMYPVRPVLLVRVGRERLGWRAQEMNKIKSERRRTDPEAGVSARSRKWGGGIDAALLDSTLCDWYTYMSPALPHRLSEHGLRETSRGIWRDGDGSKCGNLG